MVTMLMDLLPYLDKDQLNEILNKIISSDAKEYKGVHYKDILLYLDSSSIMELAEKEFNDNQDIKIYLPYLETSKIDELFVKALKEGKECSYFYPFVSQETLKNVVELVVTSNSTYSLNIKKLLPFLDNDSINLLYKYLLK
ncbi:MAG: hypothetical protein WCR97_00085 [Bacilli bacterium]